MRAHSVLDLQPAAAGADLHERLFVAALARIERGTFGLCVDCAQPIERKRLDAEPLTERCARCACRSERSRGAEAC